MTQEIQTSTPILVALLLQLMGLSFAVLIDPYIKNSTGAFCSSTSP